MPGIGVLIAYEAFGTLQAFALCKRRAPLVRVWLGLVMGLMQMMWLPALFAFFFRFTLTVNLLALGVSALTALGLSLGLGLKPEEGANPSSPPARLTLLLMLPVALLSCYLHYTHTLQSIDGSLYVGQSTYGDLCMHLSFATGLIGQSFPPEYTLLPGNVLGYPFLVDALSASMLLFGTPLSLSFALPGALMTVLVYLGFFLFSWEITKKPAAAALSLILLVFNGGLGFLYTLDLAGETGFSALKNALFAYYQAPANMPEHNLRWVNALCDLLIPQRTLMAGWLCAIPALYLLFTAMRSRKAADFAALGLWTGPMVMIHTHSFLALGAISLGAMCDELIRLKRKRAQTLGLYALYGGIAVALALPQLLTWTFPQTLDGGSLRFKFNWVNNAGDGVLRDGYLWFWIKNVGPMFLLLPIAALSTRSRRLKALSLGCLLTFLLAETVLFQPNDYDNNKLFFVVYIALLPLGASLCCDIYRRLKGLRLRALLAAAFLFCCTASGLISIVREAISSYQIFYRQEANAADYIRENTPKDALFLTATNHNNAVASLTGRKIVCGSGSYLHYHGLDYQRQEADAILMLAYPKQLQKLYDDYGIDYVYVSNYELSRMQVWEGYVPDSVPVREAYSADLSALISLYPCVYQQGDALETVYVFAVSERAQALIKDAPESSDPIADSVS